MPEVEKPTGRATRVRHVRERRIDIADAGRRARRAEISLL
jgi:hypothetical protein